MEKEGPTHPSIATLTAGSSFATTYVFRFARGFLDPRKYTVVVEASYADEDKADAIETGTVSGSTIVSPPPFLLSIVAVISSILGAVLKAALATAGRAASAAAAGLATAIAPTTPSAVAAELGQQLLRDVVTMHTVGGMVIALVVFNIYEHTELGACVKMGVGWRSALLIGVLAGVFTERLLAGLSVFVSIS